MRLHRGADRRLAAGFSIVVILLITAAEPAVGATIGFSYSVRGTGHLEGTNSQTGAADGDVVAGADSFSSLTQIGSGSRGDYGSYSMNARFGALGVAVELSGHCYAEGCGEHYLDTPLGNVSWFNDRLALVNAPASGFIEVEYLMEGSWASIANGPGWTDQGTWLTLNVEGQSFELVARSALANGFGAADSSGFFFQRSTIQVPYSAPVLSLSMRMDAWARCSTGPNGDCTAQMMFGNTGRVGGFRILDANRNEAPGASILSESGHDYAAALETAAVPEPAGLALTGIGLILLGAARRRARSYL